MRHVTDEGVTLIETFEGLRLTRYKCSAGKWTIGIGHLIRPHEDFTNPITKEEAYALLHKDLAVAEKAVLRLITVPLSDFQFNALVSFTFNLGSGALQRSGLRMKVNSGEHGDVPDEFMKWVWSGGKKTKGLMRRRAAEAAHYMQGHLESLPWNQGKVITLSHGSRINVERKTPHQPVLLH